MSEWLDEDPCHWPTDPFQLLGLEQNANAKEIRRAFFRLAKQFKPDQNPVEFQRIHEAYEAAKHYANLYGYEEPVLDGDADLSDVPAPPNETPLNSPPSVEHSDEDRQPTIDSHAEHPHTPGDRKPPSKVDLFWDYVSRAKFAEARQITPQIVDKRARESAEFYRYYFERLDDNATDSVRSNERVELLLNFLTHPVHGSTAYHWLSKEFECDPSLARNDRVTKFIAETQYPSKAVDLTMLRWKAIGKQHPELVVRDTASLAHLAINLGPRWNHVIADAMEYTVWDDSHECREFNQKCWDELSESRTGFEDQIELLIFAVEQCRTSTKVLGFKKTNQLIQESRIGFDRWMDSSWFELVKLVQSQPLKALTEFDSLFKEKGIAMVILQSGLERFAGTQTGLEDYHGSTYAFKRSAVISFLRTKRLRQYYRDARWSILRFCAANQIEPDFFAGIADQFVSPKSSHFWADKIRVDGSIHCVYSSLIATGGRTS